MTIQETHFFRNPPQIRALRRQVLPELVTGRAEHQRLRHLERRLLDRRGAVHPRDAAARADPGHRATGTSGSSRPTCRSGRSRPPSADGTAQRSVQLADAERVGRFFDLEHGDYVVKPEVRALVTVPAPQPGHRPVAVPQPRGRPRPVPQRHHLLRPRDDPRRWSSGSTASSTDGGYLFLGHAETLWQISDAFTLVTLGDAFVYRRIDPPKVERKIGLGALKAFGWRTGRCGASRTGARPRPVDAEAGPGQRCCPGCRSRSARPRRPSVAEPVAPPARRLPAEPPARARRAGQAGRYLLAAEMAESLASRDPLLAEAHYLRGHGAVQPGRDRDALDSLRKAVYLDPDAGFAHFLLAGALARLGEPCRRRRVLPRGRRHAGPTCPVTRSPPSSAGARWPS